MKLADAPSGHKRPFLSAVAPAVGAALLLHDPLPAWAVLGRAASPDAALLAEEVRGAGDGLEAGAAAGGRRFDSAGNFARPKEAVFAGAGEAGKPWPVLAAAAPAPAIAAPAVPAPKGQATKAERTGLAGWVGRGLGALGGAGAGVIAVELLPVALAVNPVIIVVFLGATVLGWKVGGKIGDAVGR